MTLVPWRNKHEERGSQWLSPLADLRQDMERVFESLREDPLGWLGQSLGSGGWLPPLDIGETAEEVVVRAELPGVKPEDLEITVTARTLVVAGEKKRRTEKKEADYRHVETRYGSFRREVALPEGVDTTDPVAEFAGGVLTLRLKKSPTGRAKRIQVKAEPASAATSGNVAPQAPQGNG